MPMITDRDYAGEVGALIDEATSHGPYVPGIIACQLVEKLRANDPDLLLGWLDAQAADFLRRAIGDRDRSIRAHTRHHAGRRAFAAAAEAHQQGDTTALDSYLTMPFSVADGSHKPLAHLTRDDLMYVRDDYQSRVEANAFYVQLADALLKRVTAGTTVADHYTPEQLAAMFSPIA